MVWKLLVQVQKLNSSGAKKITIWLCWMYPYRMDPALIWSENPADFKSSKAIQALDFSLQSQRSAS